jgi:DNA polymerase
MRNDTRLDTLREDARGCRACDLWRYGTQTVFGEGASDALVMFVGEAPGDQEDLVGRPFVGPAGQLFDRALQDAEIDRDKVYVTNAVKHFKFLLRGKRRIHQKPNLVEIAACHRWLASELEVVKPGLVVTLGATAGRAVFGYDIKVLKQRGSVVALDDGTHVLITIHPSFLLRLPDEATKSAEYGKFVADLTRVRELAPAVRLAA